MGIIEIGIVRTPFNTSPFNCQFLNAEPMAAVMTAELDWCPGHRNAYCGCLAAQYEPFQNRQRIFDGALWHELCNKWRNKSGGKINVQ